MKTIKLTHRDYWVICNYIGTQVEKDKELEKAFDKIMILMDKLDGEEINKELDDEDN